MPSITSFRRRRGGKGDRRGRHRRSNKYARAARAFGRRIRRRRSSRSQANQIAKIAGQVGNLKDRVLEKHTPIKCMGTWEVEPSLGQQPSGDYNDALTPFTLTDLSGGTANDPYNGQLIRGIANNTGISSDATLTPIFRPLDFDWTQHMTGYLDYVQWNFMWDPSGIMPTPGEAFDKTYANRPNYIYLYIVKCKDPLIEYSHDARGSGANNLDVTTTNHFLKDDGSIDASQLQADVHYTVGVNNSNVVLNDKYFDVKAKWNLSYNMKSIQSLNLPGNAVSTWKFKLPGGHRKLHRAQQWMSGRSGNIAMTLANQGDIGVNNPNLTGSSTINNNLSWIVYEPNMCDWKDQYHILGFTSSKAEDHNGSAIPQGKLHCRMDYTFSTM